MGFNAAVIAAADGDGFSVASSAFPGGSMDESTSKGSGSNTNKSGKNEPPPVVINKETRNVYCAKLVMIAVLSMTAVASALTTYMFTTNEEVDRFETDVSHFHRLVVSMVQGLGASMVYRRCV
jgi:hypothetical protein